MKSGIDTLNSVSDVVMKSLSADAMAQGWPNCKPLPLKHLPCARLAPPLFFFFFGAAFPQTLSISLVERTFTRQFAATAALGLDQSSKKLLWTGYLTRDASGNLSGMVPDWRQRSSPLASASCNNQVPI